MAYPFKLLCLLGMVNHALPYSIRIPERPYGELMQNSQFCEDIEVSKSPGFFLVAVWVGLRRFAEILTASVLVPYIITYRCQSTT